MLINGKEYVVIDAREKITIADSFVVKSNKIGSGNGEAKLYIGNDNGELRSFFGEPGFHAECFLLKDDLLKYLDDTMEEYKSPTQQYNNILHLPKLWSERYNYVSKLEQMISFNIVEQTQIIGPRVYVKGFNSIGYNLLRELSLPNITYISIVKLESSNNKTIFYFRLFADYFGDEVHPAIIQEQEDLVEANNKISPETTGRIIQARKGQGEYRRKLLESCPICPITLVSDDRLLIASHIKPWAKSTDDEKIDPMNGFMFTPTIDYLFDRGFITFTNKKEIILSPFLSKITYSRLGLSNNRKIYSNLNVKGREHYLEYHRKEIFKGNIE